MGLTKTAIARPVLVFMVMLAALIMGAISYQSMTKELNPAVNFGVVTIFTQYPGADPDAVNNLVTRRIEESVSGVQGLREVTGTSQEGVSIVICNFNLDADLGEGLNDVRSAVDRVVGALPDDATRPTISKVDTSSAPVLYLSLSSDKLDSQKLRDLVDDKLKDRFARIAGVANAGVSGGDTREIQVRLKRDGLLRFGVGVAEIQRAIQSANLNAPAGRIVSGDEEFSVRLPAEFTSVDEIRDLTLNVPGQNGGRARLVRLGDVADVQDTIRERTELARLGGRDSILLVIQKAREGDAIALVKAAKAEVAAIEKQYEDQGLKFTVTQDESKRIGESLEDLNFTVGFGIFLVCLIVYMFLHDLRGTLIVALAIPTCLFCSFIALRAAGFTINNLSMLALSLAVGVLVDDAIVVLENIYRHLKMGEDPREAAINGRSEIGVAAIAITLADVVVFLPIGFVSGIVGQFFKPLALSYVFAVIFSLFVSFTLTPMLAARWYRAGEDMEHPKGRFAQGFERVFGKLERAYGRALEWSLNHRWFVFTLGNLVLLAVFVMIAGGQMPNAGAAAGLGVGFILISTIFAMGVFAINVFRVKGDPALFSLALPGDRRLTLKMGTAIYVSVYFMAAQLVSRVLINLSMTTTVAGVTTRMPLVPPMAKSAPVAFLMAFLLGTIILGIMALVMNAPRPVAKSRQILSGAMFGTIFLAASLGGYQWQTWKGEGIFKFSFFPESDSGRVAVNIELPPGASLAATDRVVREVERRIEGFPDAEFVSASVGTQQAGQFASSSSGSNYGQVSVTLYDKVAILDKIQFWKKAEGRLREESDKTAAQKLTLRIGRIPGAIVKVSATDGFGGGSPIQFSLKGDDSAELLAAARAVRDKLRSGAVEGVINPDISAKPGKPERRAIVDRARLADAGLTASEVGSTLRILYTGDDTPQFRVRGREYTIRTMLDREDRDDPRVLETIPVRFRDGNPVFLSSVATLADGQSVDKIQRRDRQEEISLTADLLPGFAAGSVSAQINALIAREKLIPEGVTLKPLGQAESQGREGPALLGALFLGLLLVYMLLASLYDNLLYPFIIQLAQPQAFVGALLGLMITDKAFSLIGFIGLIALIGLVGKNAILLVDYANTLRDRGRDRHDALVEAGPTRLRPIMMTTLALILGMLPVAVALGRGSEFRETIGIVIIGGISLSTLLTLLVIPCSYTIFDDFSQMLAEGRRKKAEARAARRTEAESPGETDRAARAPVASA